MTTPNRYRVAELIRARRRLRAGLYAMRDAAGRDWTVERQRSGDWFASCDTDRCLYLDPLPTLKRASRAVASCHD